MNVYCRRRGLFLLKSSGAALVCEIQQATFQLKQFIFLLCTQESQFAFPPIFKNYSLSVSIFLEFAHPCLLLSASLSTVLLCFSQFSGRSYSVLQFC